MSWLFGEAGYEAVARALGERRFTIKVGERELEVVAELEQDGALVLTMGDGRRVRALVSRDGAMRWVTVGGETFAAKEARGRRGGAHDHHGGLEAPMPGKVVRIAVRVGELVDKGQTVLTLEAMKMEHALKAPRKGIVRAIGCEEGELVQPGVALVELGDLDEIAEPGVGASESEESGA